MRSSIWRLALQHILSCVDDCSIQCTFHVSQCGFNGLIIVGHLYDITDALVVAIQLPGGALAGHATLLHHATGAGGVGVVFGGDAAEIASVKQVAQHPLQHL